MYLQLNVCYLCLKIKIWVYPLRKQYAKNEVITHYI